jgi:hypothetical protein
VPASPPRWEIAQRCARRGANSALTSGDGRDATVTDADSGSVTRSDGGGQTECDAVTDVTDGRLKRATTRDAEDVFDPRTREWS